MMEGQCGVQSRRQHTRAAVVITVDALESALPSLLSLLSGSGATTEETNKRDGGGSGEKRRRHDDKLEAVTAELAWRPAVAAAVAAVVVAAAVAAAAAQSVLPQFLVRKGRSCAWLKKNTKKAIPILEWRLPELVWVGIRQYSKSGSPRIGMGFIPIWGPTHTYANTFIKAAITLKSDDKPKKFIAAIKLLLANGKYLDSNLARTPLKHNINITKPKLILKEDDVPVNFTHLGQYVHASSNKIFEKKKNWKVDPSKTAPQRDQEQCDDSLKDHAMYCH